MISRFSDKTINQLGYYVYILVDPRNNEIFYVGKGSGNRVFEHEKEAKDAPKNDRIKEIKESGYEVKKYIVYSGMKENDDALLVEAGLANFINIAKSFIFSELTNIQSTYHTTLPCMTVEEYNNHFSIESLERKDFPESEKMMLVDLRTSSIQVRSSTEKIKHKLHYLGFVSENKEKPLVLLPVFRGFIVGAFNVIEWEKREHIEARRTWYSYVPITLEENKSLSEKYSQKCVFSLMKPHSQKYKVFLYGK